MTTPEQDTREGIDRLPKARQHGRVEGRVEEDDDAEPHHCPSAEPEAQPDPRDVEQNAAAIWTEAVGDDDPAEAEPDSGVSQEINPPPVRSSQLSERPGTSTDTFLGAKDVTW